MAGLPTRFALDFAADFAGIFFAGVFAADFFTVDDEGAFFALAVGVFFVVRLLAGF